MSQDHLLFCELNHDILRNLHSTKSLSFAVAPKTKKELRFSAEIDFSYQNNSNFHLVFNEHFEFGLD